MSNTPEDELLERFFTEMKKKDLNLALPPLPSPKKTIARRWIPIGIAASLLLLLLFLNEKKTTYPLQEDIIIITLEEGENQELNISIEQTYAMDIWEPSSSSLLTEF